MKLLLLAGLVLGQSLEYPKPNIREEQQVVVNGVTETWRLQWKSPPHPECDASEGMAMAITCPCQGFAFGESGDLDVVRLRNGSEIGQTQWQSASTTSKRWSNQSKPHGSSLLA